MNQLPISMLCYIRAVTHNENDLLIRNILVLYFQFLSPIKIIRDCVKANYFHSILVRGMETVLIDH